MPISETYVPLSDGTVPVFSYMPVDLAVAVADAMDHIIEREVWGSFLGLMEIDAIWRARNLVGVRYFTVQCLVLALPW